MSVFRPAIAALVAVAVVTTSATVRAQQIGPPIRVSPPKVGPVPLSVPAPKAVLPGLSQLDPNKKGSVANGNLNSGLDYLKDRRYTVPGETHSELKPAQPAPGAGGQRLGQTSTVPPDEYIGINPQGKEMWRSGATGRVYYRDPPAAGRPAPTPARPATGGRP